MTFQEVVRYRNQAFTMAREQKKHIGALKPPKGPVIFVEIQPPVKGGLSFADTNKYPGHALLAYGLPELIPGFNKVNPNELKSRFQKERIGNQGIDL